VAARRPFRRGGDEGAALVEAAIVLPVFFMLVFGIMEVGGAIKSYSAANNAVRAGGRMASVAGSTPMADRMILERVAQEAAGLGKGEIQYVIVWNADGPGDAPPSACTSAANGQLGGGPNTSSVGYAGVSSGPPLNTKLGACNVYVWPDRPGGAFDMATGRASRPPEYYFGCTSATEATTKVDCSWPARERKVTISPRRNLSGLPTVRPDYIGVYIRAEHRYLTGILGRTLTITDSGINLIEPDEYGFGA